MKTLKIVLLLSLITILPSFAQTWEFVGLDSLVIKHLFVSGDTLWAGTDARINPNLISGLYKSTDGGNTWNQIDSTLGDGTSVCFYKNSNNSVYYLVKATGSFNLAGHLYKSTDQGKNWDIIQQLENISVDWIGISSFNENEIYVKESYFIPGGWFETVYRSTDAGSNWEEITYGFPASSHGRLMSFNLSLTDSSTLYASVNDNFGSTYFFKSTDKGDTWFYISEPPNVGRELITDPNTLNRLFIFPSYHLTTDDGYTWTIADSGFVQNTYYLSFYQDIKRTDLLYTLRTDGLYYSKRDSIFWKSIEGSENLPLGYFIGGFTPSDVGSMKNIIIDNESNTLYVGTGYGIYKRDYITDVNHQSSEDLNDFRLEQNYPNPFNPSTTISYQIPDISFITLKLYDILGNEIKTLVAEEKIPGLYQIEFFNTNLSSGVYFYILTAMSTNGKRVEKGKKMLIIK